MAFLIMCGLIPQRNAFCLFLAWEMVGCREGLPSFCANMLIGGNFDGEPYIRRSLRRSGGIIEKRPGASLSGIDKNDGRHYYVSRITQDGVW